MEDNLSEQTGDFRAQMEKMGEYQPVCNFSSDQCDKICKTQRSLRRHKITKHVESLRKQGPTATEENQATPESKPHPI